MTARARGFTLLEVALAAVLGSIVVLAALSIFASLDNAQKLGEETFEHANSSALTHEAVRNAIQNLLMSNTVAPPRNAQGERIRPGQDGTTPPPVDTPPDPRDLERPRLLLEFDLSQPPVMVDPSSQNGELMRPQRLEVTLRSRPVYVFGVEREESIEELQDLLPPTGEIGDPDFGTPPIDEAAANAGAGTTGAGTDGSTPDDRRGGSRPGRGHDRDRPRRGDPDRNDPAGAAGGGDGAQPRSRAEERREERDRARGAAIAPDVTTELVPGIRGAFEFEFDPGVAAGGLEAEPGWVLWWRQLYPVVEAPVDMDPLPGQRVGAVRLMGNIASASWKVLYTKKAGAGQVTEPERLSEHAAVWADDLPSYFELDILSNTGDHHQWTFEVGWGVSAEPGSVQTVSGSAAGVAGAAAAGAAGAGTGTGAAARNVRGAAGSTLDGSSSGSGPRSSRGSSTTGGSKSSERHQ